MTIIRKLSIPLAAIAVAGLLQGVLSVASLRDMNSGFEHAVSNTARQVELSVTLDRMKSDMYLSQRGLVLAAFIHDTNRIAQQKEDFAKRSRLMRDTLQQIQSLTGDAEARQLTSGATKLYWDWAGVYPTVVALCEAGNAEQAQLYSFQTVLPIYDKLSESLTNLTGRYRQDLETARSEAASVYLSCIWKVVINTLVLLISGIALTLVVLGVNKSLRTAIADLDGAAQQVSGAAGQVSSSSQWLAQTASQQAGSLEETSSSSREISAAAHTNASNSESAAGLAVKSQQQFEQVNAALTQMVSAMAGIGDASSKISRILRVIDEIAFQTNILALNAAVEAARAGEAGLGFSVVADEVRTLAQRCAQAAKDTAGLIDESMSRSEEGKVRVDVVTDAVSKVSQQIVEVKRLVEEVSHGSAKQNQGIESITGAITQMERLTQQSASTAEESAAAAEELNAQAGTLRHIVVRFVEMVGTGGGEVEVAASAFKRAPAPVRQW